MTARSFSFQTAVLAALSFGVWLSFPHQSLALENPQSYYDWGPSQIRVNAQVLGAQVFAQATTSVEPKPGGVGDYAKFNYFLGFTTNLDSGSPFHFLKTLQENTTLALTLDPKRKEEVRLEIAGRRLEEMERLIESKRTQSLGTASQNYRRSLEAAAEALEKAKENLPDPEGLITKYQEDAARHALVLHEVSAKVPDSAQAALETAINASEKVEDKAADLSGRAPVPTAVLDRLQALRDQGLLTAEEVQTLVSAKTRVEARELMRKYAKDGVFPEADLHKFDETAREKFEADYDRVVELKKFFEIKKLEEERPDEEIIKKVQDFAKKYKSGESVPYELRRYWVPLVRLEELQNTFRPDLLDEATMRANQGNYEKFQEVIKRIQPRPEDVAQVEKIISQNPNAALDPFYERMRRIAERFGTSEGGVQVPGAPTSVKSCPTNSHWAPVPFMPDGGYCVPNITYAAYQGPAKGEESTQSVREEVCPAKYHRNYPSGPCLPNTYFGPGLSYSTYTPGPFPSPIFGPVTCPGGYFWSGTTCLAESRACGFGTTWDPETRSCQSNTLPYFPKCGANEYAGPNGVCTPNDKSAEAGKCVTAGKFWTGRECLDKAPEGGGDIACPQDQVWDDKNKICSSGGYGGLPRVDMGNCRTPGECYDYCKANPGKCPSFDPNQPRPGDTPGTPSREAQEAACRAGGGTCVSWVNGACGCERPGNDAGSGNVGNCPQGTWWDRGTSTCRTSCPSGYSWDGRGCMKDSSPYGGGCPSGQYVGPGGYCISSYSGNTGYSPSRESQEAACRAGGGVCVSWVNNACGCERPGGTSGGGSYTCPSGQYMGPGGYCVSSSWSPTGGTGGTTTTPPSGYGSCSSGQYWNGSSCVSNTYTPPTSSESPEQACLRGTGCSWTGSSCNCSPTTTTSPTPSPSPEPTPTPAPSPSPSPEPSPSSSCSSGSYWNGSACVQGQY